MPKAKSENESFSEAISMMFAMGRFMRNRMYSKIKDSQCNSLLQFEALRYIKENDRPLMREVARHFHITPPAATLLVDGLAKEKLLLRVFDSKDRRTVRLELTTHGKRFFERGMTQRVNELKKILAVLTPKEHTQLIAILKKITKNNI